MSMTQICVRLPRDETSSHVHSKQQSMRLSCRDVFAPDICNIAALFRGRRVRRRTRNVWCFRCILATFGYLLWAREGVRHEIHGRCQYVSLNPEWQSEVYANRILGNGSEYCVNIPTQAGAVLTVAVMYNDDVDFLMRHVEYWKTLPITLRSKLEILVVDDGSSVHPAEFVLRDSHIGVHLAVIEDDIPWNIGGAMNLAFWIAPTEYVLLLDADIHASVDFLTSAVQLVEFYLHSHRISSHTRYEVFTHFRRTYEGKYGTKPHPKMMLLSKTIYWNVGGCDEDFVGHYGYTDPHFQWRVHSTPNVTLCSVATDITDFPALVELRRTSERPLSRDISINAKLFADKKSRLQRWSNVYLRFTWHYKRIY